MLPHRRRRLGLSLLLACLAAAPGCAELHNRQWGYPGGLGRLSEFRKGLGRTAKARAPQVKLGVESETLTRPEGAARAPAERGAAAATVFKTGGSG